MNTTEKNEIRLQELLDAAFPPATPSHALHNRLRLEAGRRLHAAPGRAWPRFAYAFMLGATAVVIVTGLVLFPKKEASARTLAAIYAAVSAVRQVHIVEWLATGDGQNAYLGEEWVDGDRSRTVVVGNDPKDPELREFSIRSGGREWTWSSAKNTVVTKNDQEAVPPLNPMPVALVAAARSGNTQMGVRLLADSVLNGRAMQRIAVTSPTDDHETVIWIDPDTDLPAREDITFQSRGRMVAVRVDYDYRTPMLEALFDPMTFPRDAKAPASHAWPANPSGFRADGTPDLPAPQTVAITGVYWADDPSVNWMDLERMSTAGIAPPDILLSVDFPADTWVQSSFINAAAPALTLVSPGLPDVPITYNGTTTADRSGNHEFVGLCATIAAADRAKLVPGATYSLQALNSNDAYQFEVSADAKITVPE